jgi:hypothetical protein
LHNDDEPSKQSSPAAAVSGDGNIALATMMTTSTSRHILWSAGKAHNPPGAIDSTHSVFLFEYVVRWLAQHGVRLSVNVNTRVCIHVRDFRVSRGGMDNRVFMVHIRLNRVPFAPKLIDQAFNRSKVLPGHHFRQMRCIEIKQCFGTNLPVVLIGAADFGC